MAEPEAGGRCADLSEAAGESLAATAVTARAWLLVEVPGAWPRDVSDSGALRPRPTRRSARGSRRRRSSRLQFLRRPGRDRSDAGWRTSSAPRKESSDVRRFELDDARRARRRSTSRAEASRVDASLVLVCGHGSRDRCCSLRGTAVFGALAGRLGEEELWISSHLGGHRFAANVVVLPAGLQFGRVDAEEAPYVVARALGGRIELERYRGRTSLRRARTGGRARGAASRRSRRRRRPRARRAGERPRRASGRGTGASGRPTASETESPPVPASCGDDPAPQRAFAARIVESSG